MPASLKLKYKTMVPISNHTKEGIIDSLLEALTMFHEEYDHCAFELDKAQEKIQKLEQKITELESNANKT